MLEVFIPVLVKGIRICGLPSPWVEYSSRTIRNLYYLNDVILGAVTLYMTWAYTYTIIEKDVSFQDLCSLGIGLSQLLCGIMLFACLQHLQPSLKSITDNIDSFSENISQLGQEDRFYTIYAKKSRLIPTLSKFLIILPFLTISTYVIPVPVGDLVAGAYRSKHPLPFQSPFDDKLPGVYELLLVMETLWINVGCKKNITDCLFMALFKSHSAIFQYLSVAMDDINKDFTVGNSDQGSKKLALWLELHQKVNKNIQELLSVFSPICVINQLYIIGVVVCGLFVEIKKDSDNIVQSLGIGFFVFLVIIQWFLLTNSAEELTSEAQEIAFKAYNLPWYNMKKNEGDVVRLIITMSNPPIKITAYKTLVFLMNRETYAGFLFSCVSAFVTLCQMEDRFG